MPALKVVAALVIRNERPYIANCLRHLIENEIDYVVVDNDSTDGTFEVLNDSFYARHLLNYVKVPYEGCFEWERMMRERQAAADAVDADWLLYVSADEIMHSYRSGETLRAAIEHVAESGYDVIDFNEFVFLPIDADYVSDHSGPQPLSHYYFFEPKRPRLMRARRKSLNVSHVDRGGHTLAGERFRLAPETFALRHYLFRNQEHAFRKYQERRFAPNEISRGWHANRYLQSRERFRFPPADELERLRAPEERALLRGRIRKLHYWQWPSSRGPD